MNRTKLSASAGVIVLIGLVATLRAQPQPTFSINRSFAAPAAVGPQVVYRLVPLFKTAEEVRSRAVQAGLQARSVAAMRVAGAVYTAKDPTWTFTLDTDRQIETLLDNKVLTNRYGRSLLVPDPDRCRAAAVAFIGQRKLVEGANDEGLAYERTNDLQRSYRGVKDTGPGAAPVVLLREVVFAKTIHGVPCTGPGTHLSVYVGDRGQVLGYLSNWMPAVPSRERLEVAAPTESYDELRTELASHDGRIPEVSARASQANVQQCRYVLVTAKDRTGQFIAMPGFEYRGQVTDRRQRTAPFSRTLLAARDRRALLQRLPALGVGVPLAEPTTMAPGRVAPPPGLRLPRAGGRGG